MPRKEPSRMLPQNAHAIINEHFGCSRDEATDTPTIFREINLSHIRYLTYSTLSAYGTRDLPENNLTLQVVLDFDPHPKKLKQLLRILRDIRSRFSALEFDMEWPEVVDDAYNISFAKEVPVEELNKTIMGVLEQFREEQK
ncbi:MAG TPA: hypothetical protein VHA78_06080 [Candidatus Peribacteraceae bacterium]|nr:hypothetical protein [Candidatus Peribacteraceae bacterium]